MNAPALPASLWAATAAPAPETLPLSGETRAQVCVVGGGYTGLSAALHLAEAGAEVVLLEAAEPGWGASGRNGGQVIAGLKWDPDAIETCFGSERGRRLVAFAGAAPDLVFDLIDRHGIDCAAQRGGWIQAAHAAKVMATVESRAAQWARRGAPVEVLDRAGVAALTGSRTYAGGWLDRRGGHLQPLSFARGLAHAAKGAGAAIHGGTPARALVRTDGAWRVSTPEGSVHAERVLLCTNGYTDALWPGLARSIIPAMSYQVATRPLGDNLRRAVLPRGHVVSDTRRLLAYFRLDPAGRLVIGGRGRLVDSSDPALYGHLRMRLSGLFPDLGDPGWEFHWAGRIALTLDHLPHLHEPAPGLLAALGYNGRGVALATAMGKALAERTLGKTAEELPLPAAPLRPIPLHGLRQPALALAIAWKRLLDAWDARSG
jgi:glycine/D-amino acid oxidase-like deaminating enzyme